MVPLLLQVWSQSADVGAGLLLESACKQGRSCAAVMRPKQTSVQHQAGLLALDATHLSWHGLA